MRDRIAYFLRLLADCLDGYGSLPVYVSDGEPYLRYVDPDRKCVHYDGAYLQQSRDVFTLQRDRFRVVAQTGECDSCYEDVLWLGLEFQKKDWTWQPLLLMHESRLAVLLSVLREADERLGSEPR